MVNTLIISKQPGEIFFNQLLYGYDDGHRLITGSVTPKKSAKKILLTLSDLAGYGNDVDEYGYITGYPLTQMGVYVLAKTWAAPEMPRPGCAWTHTILIDFSDLSEITDYNILNYFKRPSDKSELSSYENPIIYKKKNDSKNSFTVSSKVVKKVIEELYKFPKNKVFIESKNNTFSDQLALAIWFQQWPRLRRDFRFCTWSQTDRSKEGIFFDIQFIDNQRGINSILIPNSNCSERQSHPKFDNWVEETTKDLIEGSPGNKFRKYLWRYGAEIDGGRSAFIPLVKIWTAIKSGSTEGVEELVIAVEKILPQTPSLHSIVFDKLIELVDCNKKISTIVFNFVRKNASLFITENDTEKINKISKIFKNNSSASIWEMVISDEPIERVIAKRSLRDMDVRSILDFAKQDISPLNIVLNFRPEIIKSSEFWSAPCRVTNVAVGMTPQNNYFDDSVLEAMLNSKNEDIADTGIRIFGQHAVNKIINHLDVTSFAEQKISKKWLYRAKRYPELIKSVIDKGVIKKGSTLSFLTTLIEYNSPPVAKHRDEWVFSLNRTNQDFGENETYMHVFFIRRALSGISPEPGLLLKVSFDSIYMKLLNSELSRSLWGLLRRNLPPTTSYSIWDSNHAKRLLMGVAKCIVQNALHPKEFLEITHNDVIFEKLVKFIKRVFLGRKYLKSVSKWIEHKEISIFYTRNGVIKKELKFL